jgi:D-alanyl-D-alanine carboxypeptidase
MDELDLSVEKIARPKSEDDIPIAQRDENPSQAHFFPKRGRGFLIGGGLGIAAVALLAITMTVLARSNSSDSNSLNAVRSITPQTPTPESSPSPEPEAPEAENVLGHLEYAEAPESDLQNVTPDGRIRLRTAAAEKFLEMQQAARNQGIILVPLSGYRSVEQQETLFFDIAKRRGQVPSTRAEVSAPPGYSEHHTGYTIDIGDGNVPATNLSTKFANTSAFTWLQNNAVRYGFELSFPQDNPQGISYEPWHWRFVGDRDSLETFYKARNLDAAQK